MPTKPLSKKPFNYANKQISNNVHFKKLSQNSNPFWNMSLEYRALTVFFASRKTFKVYYPNIACQVQLVFFSKK
jgi:hypothetical protein